jgi:hypothetical protein
MATKSPTTPIGVLSFPALFKPRAPSPGAEERFSVVLIFDPAAQATPEYKAMKKAVMDAATAKWGVKAADMIRNGQVHMPFRDAAEKSQWPGFYDGSVFINPWSKQKPDVIDGRLQDVVPSDVFPGVKGRVTYTVFAYETAGKKGVSFGLNNVQLTDFTGERLDGKKKGAQDFDAMDGDDQTSNQMDEDDLPF